MKISEVHLLTDSLSETEFFYKEKLGLKVIAKTDELLSFQIGGSKLCFYLSDKFNNRFIISPSIFPKINFWKPWNG